MSNSPVTRCCCGKRWLVWAVLVVVALLAVRVYVSYSKPDSSGAVAAGRERAAVANRAWVPPDVHVLASRIVLERTGRRVLFGGAEDEHFDIEQFRLDPDGLKYGLGRERFPALIEPQFESAADADQWLRDGAEVLVVKIGDEVRVYPRDLVRVHEVVNDVVGGRAIFVAYCVLAKLGAVYDRTMGGHTYTFGVSGCTYASPDVWDGKQAFVLWDRDTESLWWPPLGRAVSGPAIDMPMQILDEALWAQSTWSRVKADYPHAVVLRRHQRPDIPRPWPKYDLAAAGGAQPSPPGTRHIAPRWGVNAQLD